MSEPTLFVGEDSVRLYQAMVTRQGLKACIAGFRLNTSYTPTNCLRTASLFTGKKYGRGKAALQEAVDDLTVLIDAAKNSAAEAVGA